MSSTRSLHADDDNRRGAPDSFDGFDRYLLVDDTDEDITQIICIIRECSPRTLEVTP